MKIKPFKLERYFAQHEFTTPYLLSCSDCEPLIQNELIDLADTESKKLWDNLVLAYTHSQGLPILREEIAKLYDKITANDIIIAAPEECIFLAMNMLIRKGDHVITTFPAYQSLYEIATSLKAHVSKWEPNDDGHFDIEELFSIANENTSLLILNFPHNPTGETINADELNQIIEFARENHIVIFSDEMYRFLEYDLKDQLPSVADIYEKGITLCGMSKSFSLPGLRMGWLSTTNQSWIEKLIKFKDYTSICPPAPSEVLSLIALRNKEQILNLNLMIIRKNLQIFEDFVSRHPDLIKWNKPKAGPIIFPEFHIDEAIDAFCLNLIEKKGLMLLPATIYDYPQKKSTHGPGKKKFPRSSYYT